MTGERDTELGKALRALEVPEHGEEFQSDLERRLAQEQAGRNRAPSARRVIRPRVRWGVVVAAAAAVVVAAIGVPRLGDGGHPGVQVEPASAAQVTARVRSALAHAMSLSGRLVSVEVDPETGRRRTLRATFAITADGDFRLHGLNRREDRAYDASRNVERTYAVEPGGFVIASERRGLAPGLPDASPQPWLLPRRLGSTVRALLAASDPRVVETTYDGRPAWLLRIDVEPNKLDIVSPDHLDVTVDQETGVPVRVTERQDGKLISDLQLKRLEVDAAIPDSTFSFRFPAGAEVFRSVDGYERVELDRVAGRVGYEPLVPETVPEGYELAEVVVADEGTPTGTEAMNPPSQKVVSLSYRRGLDQFLVTTRLRDARPRDPLSVWSDPLASGEGFFDRPEAVRLHGGALDGIRGALLIDPHAVPHIWAKTDSLIVTVSGDLDRSELVAVAESLR